VSERNLDRWYLAGVVAVGIAIVSIYAFPGYMAWDSVEQLAQARTGVLTDWHPPLMSALWGALDRVVPGPATMFLAQCTLFLVGLMVLLRRRMSHRRAALLTLGIFVVPPSLAMMAMVVKDSLMCGALLAGIAGITSRSRAARIGGLLAFGLAAGLRHNALAAVIPLLAWLCPWPNTGGAWRRAATGGLIAIALTAFAFFGNRALTDVKTHPFQYSVAPMDLIGTLRFAPPLSDAEVRELFAGVPLAGTADLQQQAKTLYDPNLWWGAIIYGPQRFFDEPATAEARDAITQTWWRLIESYPGAYLLNRLDMFRELIGLTDVRWTAVYAAGHERSMLEGTFQPAVDRNVVQRWMSKRLTKLGETSLMFRPYAYLILALALGIVLRRDRLAMALLTSSVSYLALLFIITPAPDIRYVHWLMVSVLICLGLRLFATDAVTETRASDPARAG
jgi:hypothetical protein